MEATSVACVSFLRCDDSGSVSTISSWSCLKLSSSCPLPVSQSCLVYGFHTGSGGLKDREDVGGGVSCGKVGMDERQKIRPTSEWALSRGGGVNMMRGV